MKGLCHVGRFVYRSVGRWALLVCLFGLGLINVALAGSLSSAKPWVKQVSSTARQVNYTGQGAQATYTRSYGAAAGAGTVIDAITGQILEGTRMPVPVQASRAASVAVIAKAGARWLGPLGVAMKAYDLYNFFNEMGLEPGPDENFQGDPGQPKSEGTEYYNTNGGYTCRAATPDEVVVCFMERQCTITWGSGTVCTYQIVPACAQAAPDGTQQCGWKITRVSSGAVRSGTIVVSIDKHALICPQTSLAHLAKIIGSGACWSDNRVGVSPDAAGDMVANSNPDPGDLAKAAGDAGANWETGNPSLSGPSTVPGPTTTTTTPSGTTTMYTTYNINYEGDTYTWTTTTTTTKPDGSTETETDNGPGQGETDCDKLPNSVGCTDLGEGPDDEVPKRDENISFQEESVPLPSECPAPIPMGNVGQLTFDVACDTATKIRPVVIAVAAFIAMALMAAVLRKG